MSFKLPNYTDLTNSQRQILNLPLDNNILVSGAPGTGKTVIAIYRASDLSNAGKKVLLLVYNRPLMLYISSAVKSLGIDAEVSTWQSWIANFYREEIGKSYPRVNGQSFTYDWDRIRNDFNHIGKKYDQIILDEAQDVPFELISVLKLISKSEACFMDPNQTIAKTYTRISDVANMLGVRGFYTLYDNFRNPKEIFDLAKIYNPSNKVEATRSIGEKPYMIECDDYDDQFPKIVAAIRRNYGLNYFGVFTNHSAQNHMYEQLSEEFDGEMNVFKYRSQNREFSTLDFDEPGIYVMTYNTMKGLEFDAVLLPRCEKIKQAGVNDPNVDKNIFYVAVTRASEKVYGFYFDKTCTAGWVDVFGPLKNHSDLVTWGK